MRTRGRKKSSDSAHLGFRLPIGPARPAAQDEHHDEPSCAIGASPERAKLDPGRRALAFGVRLLPSDFSPTTSGLAPVPFLSATHAPGKKAKESHPIKCTHPNTDPKTHHPISPRAPSRPPGSKDTDGTGHSIGCRPRLTAASIHPSRTPSCPVWA